MSGTVSSYIDMLLKLGSLLLVANEIRGLVLVAPVMYGLYQAGGTITAIWLAISSLGGIALSVLVPLFASRKFQRLRRT